MDFESRFKFKDVSELPAPLPFRRVHPKSFSESFFKHPVREALKKYQKLKFRSKNATKSEENIEPELTENIYEELDISSIQKTEISVCSESENSPLQKPELNFSEIQMQDPENDSAIQKPENNYGNSKLGIQDDSDIQKIDVESVSELNISEIERPVPKLVPNLDEAFINKKPKIMGLDLILNRKNKSTVVRNTPKTSTLKMSDKKLRSARMEAHSSPYASIIKGRKRCKNQKTPVQKLDDSYFSPGSYSLPLSQLLDSSKMANRCSILDMKENKPSFYGSYGEKKKVARTSNHSITPIHPVVLGSPSKSLSSSRQETNSELEESDIPFLNLSGDSITSIDLGKPKEKHSSPSRRFYKELVSKCSKIKESFRNPSSKPQKYLSKHKAEDLKVHYTTSNAPISLPKRSFSSFSLNQYQEQDHLTNTSKSGRMKEFQFKEPLISPKPDISTYDQEITHNTTYNSNNISRSLETELHACLAKRSFSTFSLNEYPESKPEVYSSKPITIKASPSFQKPLISPKPIIFKKPKEFKRSPMENSGFDYKSQMNNTLPTNLRSKEVPVYKRFERSYNSSSTLQTPLTKAQDSKKETNDLNNNETIEIGSLSNQSKSLSVKDLVSSFNNVRILPKTVNTNAEGFSYFGSDFGGKKLERNNSEINLSTPNIHSKFHQISRHPSGSSQQLYFE